MAQGGAINQWAWQTPPLSDNIGVAAPVIPQRITGTGTTEAANATALEAGRFYVLRNVSATITARYAFAPSPGLSNVVNAATAVTLAPNQELKFYATAQSRFCYAEATGTDVYDLVVYQVDALAP